MNSSDLIDARVLRAHAEIVRRKRARRAALRRTVTRWVVRP